MKKFLNIGRDKKRENPPINPPNSTRHIKDQQVNSTVGHKHQFPRHYLTLSKSSLSLRSTISKSSDHTRATHEDPNFVDDVKYDTTKINSIQPEFDEMDTTIVSDTSTTTETSQFSTQLDIVEDLSSYVNVSDRSLHSPTTDKGTKLRNGNTLNTQYSPSVKSKLSKRSSRFPMAHSTSSKPHPSTLMDPNWDTKVFKSGWVNKIADDDQEGKLFRAELKGSQLYIYKPPAELGFAKNLLIESPADDTAGAASNDLMLSNEFIQSTSELKGEKMIMNSNNGSMLSVAEVNSDIDKLTYQLDNSSIFGSTIIENEVPSSVPSPIVSSQMVPALSEDLNISENRSTSSLPLDPVELKYNSATCPHPNLTIDFQTGMILHGDMESICHTVLFYPSDSISDKLIEILPLINKNLNASLEYFLLYIEFFYENHTTITSLEMETMSRRIRRVVNVFQVKFTGLLLIDEIYENCLKLIHHLKNSPEIRTLAPPKVNMEITPYSPNTESNLNALDQLLHSKRKTLENLIKFEVDAEQNGDLANLSADEFLHLSTETLLHEINKIDHGFLNYWNPHDDISFICENEINKFNPLHFDPSKKYHYLGRLLSYHLFEDPVYSKTALLRSQVLSKWIILGNLLCDSGNMVSWLGISTVICGLPVLRLSETWGYVDPQLINEVSKKWAPVVFEVKRNEIYDSNNFKILVPRGIGSIYPKENVVPFYGDLSIPKFENSENNIKNYCWFIEKFYVSLNKWDTYFNHITDSEVVQNHQEVPCDSTMVSKKLKSVIKFNVRNGPFSVNDFMKLSLAAEYSYSQSSDKWYQNSRSPLFLGSYPSILFIDILPNYHIYDLKQLIGGIGGSNEKILRLLGNDENEFKKNRNGILKHIRDTFNLNTMDFHMVDESIIFKTELIEPAGSRPASVLFDSVGTSGAKKRMSVLSNKSFNINDYINSYNAQLGETTDEKSKVEIMIKAATIDRLIDLLVLIPSVFGSKIKPNDVKKYSEKLNLKDPVIFQMDNGLFTETFFSTYRIFYSTVELIESLQVRFSGAKSAALSIENENVGDFPNWGNTVNSTTPVNWKFVIQIQLGVLESSLELIQNYFNHFYDQLETKLKFDKFLEIIDSTIVNEWPSIINDNGFKEGDEILQVFNQLDGIYKQLRTCFIRQSFTPSIGPISLDISNNGGIPDGYCLPICDQDNDEIILFIKGLESEITKLVTEIVIEDWIDCFNIIQAMISKSSLSIFKYDSQGIETHDRLIQISNIFHWVMTMKDDGVSIMDKLPIRIKSIFEMFNKFRDFILIQIIDPAIDFETRANRMVSILKMISISRVEMANVRLFDDDNLDRSPFIPSFLESILVTTMMLPVSRFYSNAWVKAGQCFHPEKDIFDSLEDMLPEMVVTSRVGLSVCPGWVLSRIIEIVSFIPNMDVDNTNLVNFDKLRFVHTLIKKMLGLSDQKYVDSDEGLDYGFLKHLKSCDMDIKQIYEHSKLECENGLIPGDGFLIPLIKEQRLLISIEKQRYELLSSTKRMSKSNTIPTPMIITPDELIKPEPRVEPSEQVIPASNSRQSISSSRPLSVSHTNNSTVTTNTGKFKFGLFKSRPFSISIPNYNVEKRSVSITELPDASHMTKAKPVTVINLKNTKIGATYRTLNSFTISVGSNHKPVEYIFQCGTSGEVEDWVYSLTKCGKHWFKSATMGKFTMTQMITFGMPLEYLCERDKRNVPLVIEKMMREIEMRGLEEVGVYRKSGSISQIEKIREAIDKHGDFNMENSIVFDVHNITGCIKLFLRDLPDPLIPDELMSDIITIRGYANSPKRFDVYKSIMSRIPPSHYNLIRRLTQHMRLIEEWKDSNKMTSYNLATIMGGTLVNGVKPENSHISFGLMNFICEDLILNFDQVF